MQKKRKNIGAICTVLVIVAMALGIFIGILIGKTMGPKTPAQTDSSAGSTADTILVDDTNSETIPEETVSETLASGSESEIGAVVLSVNGNSVSMEEMNYYLFSIRDYYVGLYGEEPWYQTMDDGRTVSEYAKEQLLNDTIETLILIEHADEYGVSLTDEMNAAMADNAQEYISNLGTDICEQFGLTAAAVADVFADGELRNQVYISIIDKLNEDMMADANYSSLSAEEFEKAVMEAYNELLEQWKNEADIETTQIWDSIVVGSVG